MRELVAGKDFLFNDRGETKLRGFEDPVRLYEARWTEGDSWKSVQITQRESAEFRIWFPFPDSNLESNAGG